MAQKNNNNLTRRYEKMQKIIELKAYIDAQKIVLRNVYLEQEEEVKCEPNERVKRARKVYETMESFNFQVNPDKFTIGITWFDGFNGDMVVKNIDIDSQLFCFTFMTFYNSLTYRIMSALQDYNPNGWCFNEFWKTRLELRTRTTEIFGHYADGSNT